MLFGLLNRKGNRDKVQDIKQYAVDISTSFNDEDREYLKPIYSVKYYSKLNTSVIKEAIFSKNLESGDITLNQAFLTLEEILKQSIENKLLINAIINGQCVLSSEEEIKINKLQDIVKYWVP